MIIACGQTDIGMGDACIECEQPLNGAGFAAEVGQVCSEDCAVAQSARIAVLRRQTHLHQRDLLCNCAAYCAPAGLPTAAMRQEYAEYQASQIDSTKE